VLLGNKISHTPVLLLPVVNYSGYNNHQGLQLQRRSSVLDNSCIRTAPCHGALLLNRILHHEALGPPSHHLCPTPAHTTTHTITHSTSRRHPLPTCSALLSAIRRRWLTSDTAELYRITNVSRSTVGIARSARVSRLPASRTCSSTSSSTIKPTQNAASSSSTNRHQRLQPAAAIGFLVVPHTRQYKTWNSSTRNEHGLANEQLEAS